jgi:hypothetical protein
LTVGGVAGRRGVLARNNHNAADEQHASEPVTTLDHPDIHSTVDPLASWKESFWSELTLLHD